MNILYFAEDYNGSDVHHNLAASLSTIEGCNVIVFASLREHFSLDDSIKKFGAYNYQYIYAHVDISFARYKYVFSDKVKCKLRLVENKIDFSKIDYVLASTTFSDGAVAYEINKKYHIPYLLFVRNTDVNFYARKMFHLWFYGSQIIRKSTHIVFVSESMRRLFYKSIFSRIFHLSVWNSKSIVIPNGIDEIWHNNIFLRERNVQPKSILYIGNFSSNKNVPRLIKAFELLQCKYSNIELNLIGGGGKKREKNDSIIINKLIRNNSSIHFLGKVYDKQKLLNIIRHNDFFVMVSHYEPFGLVYLEVLSQGLPIVYTEGQGIDGLFDDINIGEKANSKSVKSIYNAMENVIVNYSSYDYIGDKIDRFSWKSNAMELFHCINELS